MHKIREDGVSDGLISDVLARDCVLWLTAEIFTGAVELEQLVRLTGGPWRGIFVESSSAEFASALEARSQAIDSADAAGAFTHLIASDPLALKLQRRAKPIFFLNGRRIAGGDRVPTHLKSVIAEADLPFLVTQIKGYVQGTSGGRILAPQDCLGLAHFHSP